MVKRCAWGTCNSDSRYLHKDYMKGVQFFPIPKPKTRLEDTKIWVKACGRKFFTVLNVNKHSYVCSKHFVDGRPTDIHPYPMSADSRRAILKGRKPVARRLVENRENVGIITSKYDKSSLDVQVPEPSMFISIGQEDECTSAGSSENTELEVGDHLYARPVEIVSLSVSTQTNLCMKGVSGLDDESLMDRGTLKRKLLTDDVFKSDKSCKFYTGLSLAVFSIIFNVLKLKASSMVYWNSTETNERQDSKTPRRGPKRLLSLKEEFTLTLLRLRKGVDNKSLSDMFAISESSVSRIFTTWLCLMNVDLDFLIRWPSKDQVLENLPKCFKHLKKTRCIIDCTEFFVQKPSLPSAQRITYSNYKHHNTFKCLVGITPTGSFCFVSELFTGSISDKKIVQDSGFLNHVEFGDDIMADRGFLIRGELAMKGATLNIPPFSFGKQLGCNATTKTRRIARARIHVERAIGRLKNYAILQGVIALHMKPLYNQIVRVCAMLCNLDTQLVK